MTILCPAPDPAAGVAVRLIDYLDCQARALGENGFQALVGGPLVAGLVSALVTVFVALIGFRLIVGAKPKAGDLLGWSIRLGFVLAMVTAWPAFQTLAYNVSVRGPAELAATLLPSANLPSTNLAERVQRVYNGMRTGAVQLSEQETDRTGELANTAVFAPQNALPRTALVYVVSTVGLLVALKLAVGFLLAVAPLPILALLFDATFGLFAGWVRALAGAAFAVLAATIVTALSLVLAEGELVNIVRAGGVARVADPQALSAIVVVFAFVGPILAIFAARVTSAFGLQVAIRLEERIAPTNLTQSLRLGSSEVTASTALVSQHSVTSPPPRVLAVTGALRAQTRHETNSSLIGGGRTMVTVSDGAPSFVPEASSGARDGAALTNRPRTSRRTTRSAARRDRVR